MDLFTLKFLRIPLIHRRVRAQGVAILVVARERQVDAVAVNLRQSAITV